MQCAHIRLIMVQRESEVALGGGGIFRGIVGQKDGASFTLPKHEMVSIQFLFLYLFYK